MCTASSREVGEYGSGGRNKSGGEGLGESAFLRSGEAALQAGDSDWSPFLLLGFSLHQGSCVE